jgi:hypothetical protein
MQCQHGERKVPLYKEMTMRTKQIDSKEGFALSLIDLAVNMLADDAHMLKQPVRVQIYRGTLYTVSTNHAGQLTVKPVSTNARRR